MTANTLNSAEKVTHKSNGHHPNGAAVTKGQTGPVYATNTLHPLGEKIFLDRYALKDGKKETVAVGDLVEVKGLYEEYFDFSEINVSTDATGYFNNLGVHDGAIYPLYVTMAQLAANAEPYEGCYIAIVDPMMVTAAPNNFGEWTVESQMSPGTFLIMDDYWYDDTTVMLGDCYCCASGVLAYSFGAYKLEVFENAICIIECAVSNEDVSFGQLKASFR